MTETEPKACPTPGACSAESELEWLRERGRVAESVIADRRCEAEMNERHANDMAKELAELRAQNHRLQQRCGELLQQRRGIRYLVHEFHHKFGYPVRTKPQVPSDDEVRFRLRLIAEEFFELLEACICTDNITPRALLKTAKGAVDALLSDDDAPVRVDLPAAADAMADLDYVVEGTRLTFGIDGWPVLLEVQRANLAKEGAGTDEGGKLQKPDGWHPPDIAGELRRQGWEG